MSQEVEELFGGAGQPIPHTRRIWVLLGLGMVLANVGIFCSTIPGGILVLLAWAYTEKEMERLETGYLSSEFRPALEKLYWINWIGVLWVIGLFIVQNVLFCSFPFYQNLLKKAVELLRNY